ncbi:hypothetical protein [Limosilactobacillus caecicola]|uniref:hypothetical protein n=1 Tax=Limosilactobacillus caecicola TaxID=2941332 RepID=UPI00203E59B4|nr:hypothetical protein [Limosilactobacillus caecicola]
MDEKVIIEKHLFSDTSKYNDIIEQPHHVSNAHLPMSQHDRAAQFAPFSALTGYHQLIDQTAKNYQKKEYLSAAQAAQLNRQLHHLHRHNTVEINYFNAESGFYETIQAANLMTVDWQKHRATFTDQHDHHKQYSIPLANIRTICQR